MSENALNNVFEEVLILIEPLEGAATDQESLIRFFRNMGWNFDENSGMALANITSSINQIAQLIESVKKIIDEGEAESLEQVLQILNSIKSLFEKIETLADSFDGASLSQEEINEVIQDISQFLLVRYLARNRSLLIEVFRWIEVIQIKENSETVFNATGKIIRYPYAFEIINFDNLISFLGNPVQALGDIYVTPFDRNTVEGAKAFTDKLFPRLGRLAQALGAVYVYGIKPAYGIDFGAVGNEMASGALTIKWRTPLDELYFGATLAYSPRDRGNLGWVITPFGELKLDEVLGEYYFQIKSTFEADAIIISDDGNTSVESASGLSKVDAGLLVEKLSDDETGLSYLIGEKKGSRLELGKVSTKSFFEANAAGIDFDIHLDFEAAKFVISSGGQDGFLQQILPKDGVHIDFDLAIGWSNKKGLYFSGGAGLETTLPINKNLFDLLLINSVYLAILAKESGISLAAATSVTLKMGPVVIAIEQMGLQAKFTFPQRGGNLGPVNLELGFKPPNGAGLAIDASIVVGAGFLKFDEDKQLYYGLVHLEIAEMLNVTAVGLITTRMPDGSPGFSLLALVAVQFAPPIQLGYGFTLNGLGGILGVNRTASVEVLRNGLRTGTLGSVLFPVDPANNAMKIVSDLAAVFPTAEGRYLFGPMAILGWGPNALIKLELGLILELPEPVRLMILGRLRVLLPEENNAVVKLQLDSLGVINFTTGDVSLDAVLYDSEIKGFAITGEMALRANFGASPGFLLSVGGFHPAFKAPTGFPSLERVAISLACGDNPRLRLAAYMAITTNTIQFGSLLELYAEASGFSLEGRLSFDALIQLEPFGLAVGFGAMVAIKFNKAVLFCVSLDANLTGPDPWHVWGEARFVFLGFSASIPFNLQVGEKQTPSLPDPVDLYQILETELENNNNWSTQLPRDEHPLVVLREQPKGVDQMLAHPLADLAINQRIVPLDVNISYFGSALLEGGVQKFALEVTDAAQSNDLDDWFAPAQYWAMSDDEKLSADSFVRMKSGVQFAKRGYECGQAVEEADMQYEIKTIIDMSKIPVKPAFQVRTQKGRALRTPIKSLSHVLEKTFIEQVVSSGAVGIGALQRTGKAKYRNPLEEILEPAFYLKPRVNNQEVYHE